MKFSRYISLLKKRDRLAEQIESLECNLYCVHPSTWSDMPRGSLRGTDGITDNLEKLFELRDELDAVGNELEAIAKTKGITSREESVACQREVLQASWKEIAETLKCSVRHAWRIYNNLVEKFA